METVPSYQSFLDKLGCPGWILDAQNGTIVAGNWEAIDRLGYLPKEFTHIDAGQNRSAEGRLIFEEGATVKVRQKNNGSAPIEFNALVMKIRNGDFVLLVADGKRPASKYCASQKSLPGYSDHPSFAPFAAVHELLTCRDFDMLCRKAVEIAWEQNQGEQCALYLNENGGQLRGTFGINQEGAVYDEKPSPLVLWENLTANEWRQWEQSPAVWLPRKNRLPNGNGAEERTSQKWQIAVELRSKGRLAGVLFCTRAQLATEPESGHLQSLASYGAVLGEIIAQMQPEAVRESSNYKRFFENPAVGMLAVTLADGQIITANAVIEQITGFTPEEIQGRCFFDLLLPEHREEHAQLFSNFRPGEMEGCCTRPVLQRKDGTAIWVHVTLTIAADESGIPPHALIIVEDINAWRDAERQRRALKEGLQLITTAANELLACGSLDQLCRKTVELVRERLKLDRAALFLLDVDGNLQGTYGTTLEGTTSDERNLSFDRQSWAAEFLPPWKPDQRRWIVRRSEHESQKLNSGAALSASDRWLTVTPVCSAEGPIGIFCNDNAITGASWNESAQELVTMLATVLGTIIREKRAEEELWHARLSLEQRVRERTAQLDLANTALQLEICERQRAERELRSVAKHARCILWYAKIQGLPGWNEPPGDARCFRWNLHVQDEVAAQRVLPLEVPAGRTYAEALSASFVDVTQVRQAAVRALQGNKDSYAQEFCCRDLFGQLRWLREDVQLQRLADDRWEAFGLITDVTTRKQAREEILRLNKDLQDRVTELQTLLDTAPIGIAIALDPDCSHISANPHLARILGIAPEISPSLSTPLSDHASEFVMCRDGKELAPENLPMQMAARGQAVNNVQFEIIRGDGDTVQAMASAVPLLDENGDPRGSVTAFADITERVRAEEELRNVAAHTGCILWHAELKEIKRSEEELQQGLPRFVWRVQIQDEKAAQKVLPLDVLPGQRYVDVWFSSRDPEDSVHIESLCIANLNAGRSSWSYEYRCVNQLGEVQWLFESIRIKQRRSGRWQVFGVFLDVTERKRAHEEMARLAAIVESSDDAIISATLNGTILTWNAGAEKLFGYTAEQAKGKPMSILVPDDREDEARQIQEKVSSGKYIPPFETVRLRKDGSLVQLSLSVSPIRDPSSHIIGLASAARDISASKRLERDVLDISAHEQQRIGQDLHDGICQQLTGAYFLTSVLKHKLEASAPALAWDASQIATLLSTVTEQARQLARGLHPLEAGPLGLMAALGELADQVNTMFKVKCRFVCDRPVSIEDSSTATHLYRIAQEATNNAVRHGEASHINIELRDNNGEIWLIVEDNGKGFHNELEAYQGMGLRTMRYRAGVIGAQLIIESGSPGGTLVCCILPLGHARAGNTRSNHSPDITELPRSRGILMD